MKTIFLIIFLSIICRPYVIRAQIKAHAGEDRHFCYTPKKGYSLSPANISQGLDDTLGEFPSATGGTKPYSYYWTTWSDMVDVLPKEIDAREYLDSIGLPNPKIIKIPFKQKPFFLTITDSLGRTSRDTVIVSITRFQLIVDKFFKRTKDTIDIYQQYWVFQGLSYYWERKNFISDTSQNPTKVWNIVNDSLKAWSIDDKGCRSDTNDIKIFIDNSIVISNITVSNEFLQFQNPVQSSSVYRLKDTKNISRIAIYNNQGDLIHTQSFTNEIAVGAIINRIGIYYLILYHINGTIIPIKITRE